MDLIVARDCLGGIGKGGELPWPRLSNDMRWFREKTIGKTVVMGKTTWESLGKRPLKDRHNIVITHHPDLVFEDNVEFMSIEGFLERDNEDTVVIGGSILYNQLIDKCEILYVTEVLGSYGCDTFFTIPEGKFCRGCSIKLDDNLFVSVYRRIQDVT